MPALQSALTVRPGVRCVLSANIEHIMRTNIDIDDELMAQALKAGPYKTKKDAVEAGLKLLARQASYREIAKWRGRLQWEGDESIDWTSAPPPPTALRVQEPASPEGPRCARR